MFEIYNSEKFRKVLTDIYQLKTVKIKKCRTNFFESKNKLRKNIFYLPHGFFCDEISSKKILELDWKKLQEFSIKENKNLTLTSLYISDITKNYLHVANNPVLELKKENIHYSSYSKNHRKNLNKELNKSSRENVDIFFSEDMNDLVFFYCTTLYTNQNPCRCQILTSL